MRLHAFFALLLIAHVCSAELSSFQEQVLEKINTLTEKVDALFELRKQDCEGTTYIVTRIHSFTV